MNCPYEKYSTVLRGVRVARDICTIEGCVRVLRRRGLCKAHYHSALEDGSITRMRSKQLGKTCRHAECSLPAKFRDLCPTHYARWKNAGEDDSALYISPTTGLPYTSRITGPGTCCSIAQCKREVARKGLCDYHAGQVSSGKTIVPDPQATRKCPVAFCKELIGVRSELCTSHSRLRWMYSLEVEWLINSTQAGQYLCSNPSCGSDWDLGIDHDHSCCPPGKWGDSRILW